MTPSSLVHQFLWLVVAAVCVAEAQQQQSSLVRAGATIPSSAQRSSRSLLCLGIFRDCGNTTDSSGNSTDNGDGQVGSGSGGDGILGGDFCLGIFRDCNATKTPSNSTSSGSKNCTESSDGIFGGRPIFGECGIINELLGGVFNGTDTNGDGKVDTINFGTNESDKGPFGLGILPEGGLLWNIFNHDDDVSIIEAIMGAFETNTNSFSFAFLQEWNDSAVVTNKTCTNAAAAPDCFDSLGDDGFWVCRTLADPFTGRNSSKSVCISEGDYLKNNDSCGCCKKNSTAVCPAVCKCACDLNGSGDGVWVQASLDVLDSSNSSSSANRCVDPRWAVTVTSRFERIACLEKCPTA